MIARYPCYGKMVNVMLELSFSHENHKKEHKNMEDMDAESGSGGTFSNPGRNGT